MAHHNQDVFIRHVRSLHPKAFTQGKVLDCGSLDINGNNRGYFAKDVQYTGIDLGEGPNVDQVASVNQWYCSPRYNPYDTVISTEMLEHSESWAWDIGQMFYMLKPGGLLVVTAAGVGRHEHGTKRTTPQDSPFTCDSNYYQNITNGMFLRAVSDWDLEFSELFVRQQFQDFQMYGIKA